MMPGDQLGPYKLEQYLGGGGMSDVWKAKYIGPSGNTEVVAIKCLKPAFASSEALQKRFKWEGERHRNLVHQSIVRAGDFFQQGGRWYLVLDFVDGVPLSERMQKNGGPLPLSDVLELASQILDALHYFHEQKERFVHRDVKPSNILLNASGTPFLIDLGISFAEGQERVTR